MKNAAVDADEVSPPDVDGRNARDGRVIIIVPRPVRKTIGR